MCVFSQLFGKTLFSGFESAFLEEKQGCQVSDTESGQKRDPKSLKIALEIVKKPHFLPIHRGNTLICFH